MIAKNLLSPFNNNRNRPTSLFEDSLKIFSPQIPFMAEQYSLNNGQGNSAQNYSIPLNNPSVFNINEEQQFQQERNPGDDTFGAESL